MRKEVLLLRPDKSICAPKRFNTRQYSSISMSVEEESLNLHREKRGKIRISPTVEISNKHDLAKIYSPGVAAPSQAIAKNKEAVYQYTSKQNNVAIVTDGTAVLGLGDVGPEASIPVMEGKAALFKYFADIDGYPVPLDTTNPDEIIAIVKAIAPYYNGINLEDIKAPECFTILEALQDLPIPVFHDDQYGTAIVILTGLINGMKLTNKSKEEKIVINGAGAAGIATAKLLLQAGYSNITVLDSKGILSPTRKDMNSYKLDVATQTNAEGITGSLSDAIKDASVFIGVSIGNILSEEHIQHMRNNPIIFALANPTPEIHPEKAKDAGAAIIATGRSDYPNQVNNALVFPGLFKGLIENERKNVSLQDMAEAAQALADLVHPSKNEILPDVFNEDVVPTLVKALS